MSKLPLAAGLLFAAGLSAQSTIVVPPGAATAEQNSTTTAQPLSGANLIAGTGSTARTQYVYDSTNFSTQGVTTPVLITKLRFRANGVAATWGGCTIPNLRLDMSTAAVDYLATTTTFDSNHGTDRATVYNTAATVQAGTSVAATTGTAPGGTFVAELDLLANGAAFPYHPGIGDLVFDFMSAGASGTLSSLMPAWDTLSTSPPAKRCASNNNGQFVTTGSVLSNAVVMEITYIPYNGLFAAFTASATRGPSPLAVTFTDQSWSQLGPITSWAWDFENDGVDDDFTQNPTHTFGCGNYNVKLTVSDGTNTISTIHTGQVITDLVSPSFTWLAAPAYGAPGRVQFTDTTTPPATAWAWDFNGDSVVDSTLQNPTYDFSDYLVHNVSLTTSRNCAVASTGTNRVVAGQSLTTTFAGGSAGTTNWLVMFDLNVTNPLGIELKAADLRWNATPGNPVTADVYVTPNSCVGAERNASLWRKLATATGTAGASAQPTLCSFNNTIYLAPGSYGIGFHGVVGGLDYSGSTTLGTYSNSDLAFSNSRVMSGLFLPTGGSLFVPRVWNGRLYYATASVSGEASYGWMRNGCAGTFGTARTFAATQPSVGTTFQVDFQNLPADAVIAIWGWDRTNSVFGPLPLDLSSFGMGSCTAFVSTDVTQFLVGPPTSASASFFFAIPNWSILLGAPFYMQGLVLDPAANSLGATMSDAGAGVIGL